MKVIIDKKEIYFDIANTFSKRLIGLIGQKHILNGLLFPKCHSLHTFFMRENIDVIALSKDYQIIDLKVLKKNRIYIKKEAYYLLELPFGSIHNLKIGNKLIIYD